MAISKINTPPPPLPFQYSKHISALKTEHKFSFRPVGLRKIQVFGLLLSHPWSASTLDDSAIWVASLANLYSQT